MRIPIHNIEGQKPWSLSCPCALRAHVGKNALTIFFFRFFFSEYVFVTAFNLKSPPKSLKIEKKFPGH